MDYQIRLLTETKQAATEISSFAKSVTSIFKTGLGIGIAVAAFDKLADAMAAPINAAIEQEKAIASLNIALASSGDFSEANSKQFQALATEMQNLTTIQDDAALSAFALAKNLGLTDEQTKKTVKAAADLSAAFGVDLETATQAVAKSLEGQNGQLGRLIPQTKNFTEAQLKAGAALDFVSSRFAGAAEALTKTFGGATTQAKNSFGELLDTIGGFITQSPVIVFLINSASKAFASFNEFLIQNSGSIRIFVEKGIVFLIDSFSFLISIIQKGVIPVFNLLLAAFFGLFNATAEFGRFIGKLTDPITNVLVKGISFAVSAILDFIRVLSSIPGVDTGLASLGFDVKSIQKSLDGAAVSAAGFGDSFDVGKIRDDAQAFGNDLIVSLKTGADGVQSFLGDFDKKVGAFGKKTESLVGTSIANATRNGTKIGINSLNDADLQKLKEKIQKAYQDSLSNPFETFLKIGGIKVTKEFSSELQGQLAGSFQGLSKLVTEGAEGARKAVVGVLTAAAVALLGPVGQALGPLFDALSQGPEAIKSMIKQFTDAIPIIIQNIILAIPDLIVGIVDAIPILIQALVDSIPQLVDSLIAALPRIITSLVLQMPRIALALASSMPSVALKLATSLIGEAPKIVAAIIEGIAKGIGGAVSGAGKGIVGGVKSIGKKLGFAEGGIVPGGAPFTDRVSALLTPGEVVLNRDQVAAAQAEKISVLGAINNLAASISGGGSQNMTVNLVISEERLAQVILNLNRQGYRLA